MKMTLKLDRKQDLRQVVSQMVNDLLDEGYTVTRTGPNSMILCKEGPSGKKFARIFVVDNRTLEVIKRAG